MSFFAVMFSFFQVRFSLYVHPPYRSAAKFIRSLASRGFGTPGANNLPQAGITAANRLHDWRGVGPFDMSGSSSRTSSGYRSPGMTPPAPFPDFAVVQSGLRSSFRH